MELSKQRKHFIGRYFTDIPIHSKTTEDYKRYLKNKKRVRAKYVAEWGKHHREQFEMLAQVVVQFRLHERAVVNTEMRIIPHRAAVQSEVERVRPEIIMIDQGDERIDRCEKDHCNKLQAGNRIGE